MPRFLELKYPVTSASKLHCPTSTESARSNREAHSRNRQHRSQHPREGSVARAVRMRSCTRSRLKILIEGDLRREIQSNLKRLQAINCYRGIRHRRGLARARTAHIDQCTHPQGAAQDRRRATQSKTPRPAKFKIHMSDETQNTHRDSRKREALPPTRKPKSRSAQKRKARLPKPKPLPAPHAREVPPKEAAERSQAGRCRQAKSRGRRTKKGEVSAHRAPSQPFTRRPH